MNSALDKASKVLKGVVGTASNGAVAVWAAFVSASLFIYFFMSDQDFSFLLTYGSFCRCFGLGVLLYKMHTGKSAKGVSLKTLQLYAVVFFCRLASIVRHQGYLPFDKTGDWFYHVVEAAALAFTGACIYYVTKKHASTYDEKFDAFGNLHIPSRYGAAYILFPCIVLAVLIHPGLNNSFLSDTAWTLSMYLECVAMLPQLYMMMIKVKEEGGAVEWLLSHFVAALGFSRVSEIIFWISSHKELAGSSSSPYVGILVLLTQVAHLIIMADFFFYYIRALRKGGPMELPTHMGP